MLDEYGNLQDTSIVNSALVNAFGGRVQISSPLFFNCNSWDTFLLLKSRYGGMESIIDDAKQYGTSGSCEDFEEIISQDMSMDPFDFPLHSELVIFKSFSHLTFPPRTASFLTIRET